MMNVNFKGLESSAVTEQNTNGEPNPATYIYSHKIATFSKYPGGGRGDKKSQPYNYSPYVVENMAGNDGGGYNSSTNSYYEKPEESEHLHNSVDT